MHTLNYAAFSAFKFSHIGHNGHFINRFPQKSLSNAKGKNYLLKSFFAGKFYQTNDAIISTQF